MIRLGVDFGSSGTVLLRFDTGTGSADGEPFFSPNIVHIAADGTSITGLQVAAAGLSRSDATARHLRHSILRGSSCPIGAGPHQATCRQAGKDYLVSLIKEGLSRQGAPVDETVFSVPADAPPRYSEWIASVAAGAGLAGYRTIDELTAACLGYGIPVRPDQTVLLVDFGADALEVSMGSPEGESGGVFRSCRVAGRAVADVGGRTIDRWLAEELWPGRHWREGHCTQDKNGVPDEMRQVKETLSFRDEAAIMLPVHGSKGGPGRRVVVKRRDLETLLDRHNLYGTIGRTIEKALSTARAKGVEEHGIAAVLLIGGGCLIPSVRDLVVQRFGSALVRCDRPREAVALGAARHSSGDRAPQRITRDYALRYWDLATRRHQYRYIVRCGMEYPTGNDVSRLLITASYDGQTHLGLALYALGKTDPQGISREIELVSDPDGSLRCLERKGPDSGPAPARINADKPTLLEATPPAVKGDVRFELAFRIDGSGHLMVTARDVRSGEYILSNHCMATLT